MLPSVNVIYIRIDQNLIPISYKQKKRKNGLGRGGNKFSKLKNIFKHVNVYNTFVT